MKYQSEHVKPFVEQHEYRGCFITIRSLSDGRYYWQVVGKAKGISISHGWRAYYKRAGNARRAAEVWIDRELEWKEAGQAD